MNRIEVRRTNIGYYFRPKNDLFPKGVKQNVWVVEYTENTITRNGRGRITNIDSKHFVKEVKTEEQAQALVKKIYVGADKIMMAQLAKTIDPTNKAMVDMLADNATKEAIVL